MAAKIVVFELGPDLIRVGWAHETGPACSFSSAGAGLGKSGYIEDWNKLKEMMRIALETNLKVSAGDGCYGVIVIPPETTLSAIEYLARLCFEEFAFEGLSVRLDTSSTLLMSSLNAGVCVRVDAGIASVAAVYDGYTLPHAVLRSDQQAWISMLSLDASKKSVLSEAAYSYLAEKVIERINKCAVDMRSRLYGGIVFSGSRVYEAGSFDRLKSAVILAAPKDAKVNLILAHYPDEVAWRGGAKYANSPTFIGKCTSKQEYDESGPGRVSKMVNERAP